MDFELTYTKYGAVINSLNQAPACALDNQGRTMETADHMIVCRTCGKEFAFTVREQEFFATKGFDEPRHCPECRAQRKREKNLGNGTSISPNQAPSVHSAGAEWSEVVCASCGKPASVPFRPISGRPVYCRDCFTLQKAGDTVKIRNTVPEKSTKPIVDVHISAAPSTLSVIPRHILEEDMGPLPDFDPAPDEEGEITMAEFVPMGGSFGATSEEVNPSFEETEPASRPEK